MVAQPARQCDEAEWIAGLQGRSRPDVHQGGTRLSVVKTTGTVESRQKIEELLQRTGAQLWIGHSMEFFRTVRGSPAWYD